MNKKIKINSKELHTLLQSLTPGLASKEILEQSKCFIFTDGWVCTYNDRIMVQRPLPFDFEDEGAVNAQEILTLLSRMPEQTLTLEFGESHLKLKGKRSQTKVPLHNEVKLPVNEIEIPEEYDDLPENFVGALSFCLFSCARDMSYPVLTCLKIDVDEVVSCDNARGTRMELSEEMELGEPLLIPYYAVQELIDYDLEGISVTEDWVHFSCADDVVFSCRTVEGEYPDTSKLFQSKGMLEFTLPEEELLESLERAQIFSKAEIALDEHVTVSIKDDHLILKGSSEKGEHKERLALEEEPDDDISFSIHPSFLRQIIERQNFTMKEDGSRLLVEGEDFSHVALLYAEEEDED